MTCWNSLFIIFLTPSFLAAPISVGPGLDHKGLYFSGRLKGNVGDASLLAFTSRGFVNLSVYICLGKILFKKLELQKVDL